MEKFADFMYYLLTSPFKRIKKSQNQWYILFQVLGSYMDHAGETLFEVENRQCLQPAMHPCSRAMQMIAA